MTTPLRRPHTVNDAGAVLDLQPRTARRLAAEGKFGRLRPPTRAERKKFGLPVNARIVRDMGVVQRLKKARERAVVDARLAARKRARRRNRR